MVSGWAGWFHSTIPSFNAEHEYSATGPFFGGDGAIAFGSFFGRQGNCDDPSPVCSGEFVVEVWGPDPAGGGGGGDGGGGGGDEPCAVSASLHAFAAGSGCTIGALPFGQPVSIKAPATGKAGNLSTARIPPELLEVLIEIHVEREAERMQAALEAVLKKPGGQATFRYCMWFADTVLANEDTVGYELGAHAEACIRLALRSPPPARRAAEGHAAAEGCRAAFIPVFPKGTKVTRKLRRRAASAARSRLRLSCKVQGDGTMSASVKARGKKATLNPVLGKRVRARLGLYTPTGTTRSERLGVRWDAKKR
jgi:hypothetical protein